ncbi:sugar transferase [Roseinatronobacter sp. NSM]|uniref:sugar transferase n=1 Tax=Roseinatronobacter sp. NSM TaxID=3457785 RepID=UPI00403730CE
MSWSKRLFDLLVLLVLSPILVGMLLVSLMMVWVGQGRPLFYCSERMRAPGQPFWLWKLRSMTPVSADSGVSGGDKLARITPTGRILRRSRMDELPQMLNILRGDVSFVGPRPPLRLYVDRFPELYAQVLQSCPGVTGLASLVFAAHENRLLSRCTTPERTDEVYARICVPRKARIDLIYQRNWSLGFDFWLVLVTTLRVLGLMKRTHRRFPRPPSLRQVFKRNP